jgi:hypothetical protein
VVFPSPHSNPPAHWAQQLNGSSVCVEQWRLRLTHLHFLSTFRSVTSCSTKNGFGIFFV